MAYPGSTIKQIETLMNNLPASFIILLPLFLLLRIRASSTPFNFDYIDEIEEDLSVNQSENFVNEKLVTLSQLSQMLMEPRRHFESSCSDMTLSSQNSFLSHDSRLSPDSYYNTMISQSSSPDSYKFICIDDSRYRPRGSSFNLHLDPNRKLLHVSFGWIQFSDERMMPTEDMPDTPENRHHIMELMLADARHGNLEYFRYLVNVLKRLESNTNQDGSLKSDLNDKCLELDIENKNSMIHAAVLSDNVDVFLEVMAFKGITFSDLNPIKSAYSNSAAFITADSDEDGDMEGDIEETPSIEETVLGHAIAKNSISIVRLLLDNGVRDDYPEKSFTALHLAIKFGHEILVNILLDQGNSQIDRINEAYETPLMTAIAFNHPKIVQLLIDKGAALWCFDYDLRSILHHGAINGNLDILLILKQALRKLSITERKGLIAARDIRKNSPLHLANSMPAYLFLRDHIGINPENRNAYGELPYFSK